MAPGRKLLSCQISRVKKSTGMRVRGRCTLDHAAQRLIDRLGLLRTPTLDTGASIQRHNSQATTSQLLEHLSASRLQYPADFGRNPLTDALPCAICRVD